MINNIVFNRNLSFTSKSSIKFKNEFSESYDIKHFEKFNADSFECSSEIVGNNENDYDLKFLTLNLKDKNNKPICNELLRVEQNYMYGMWIYVDSPLQNHKGYGEKMRLLSVMELMENPDQESINIFSLDKALLFHSKYFKSNITSPLTMRNKLKNVSDIISENIEKNDTLDKSTISEFEMIDKKATILNDKILDNINSGSTKNTNTYLQKANNLFDNYFKLLRQNKLFEPVFVNGLKMNMVLSKEDILENKDYYNSLFEKHNIDYQI